MGRIENAAVRFGVEGARGPIAALAVAVALLAAALAGGAGRAEAASPVAGDASWIWYVSDSGGSGAAIGRAARRHGLDAVYVKSGDGSSYWSQFDHGLVRAIHDRGIDVCAWQFVYGNSPKKEARIGARAVEEGADCLIIDAEGDYEGRYAAADTYLSKLRRAIGDDYPLALSSFPYVDYHPAFPYSVFLGPGGAQYNLPQLYWYAIGDPLVHSSATPTPTTGPTTGLSSRSGRPGRTRRSASCSASGGSPRPTARRASAGGRGRTRAARSGPGSPAGCAAAHPGRSPRSPTPTSIAGTGATWSSGPSSC